MNSLVFLVALVVFWAVFLTIIFRLEKRMVWPYGDLESAPHFGDPTGYGASRVAQAVECGFTLLGWARDLKGPKYHASYAMMVSPERDMFAIIGTGSVMSIPVAATWLHSPTADGRSFYSTDKQSGVQIDVSHNWVSQLAPAFTFRRLLDRHREWIRINGVLPRPLARGRELAEFRALREEHFRSMEHAGLIRFADGAGTHFRFTAVGAARTACWSYFLGMARQVSRGTFPRSV